jgi:hypothetical protein
MTAAKKKRKTRRKKSHYKTGVHNSPKAKHPINYRSGWEKVFCMHLDQDPNVVSYAYEPYKIPYIANSRSHRVRFYLPDFEVTYADGTKKLIEVKRASAVNNLLVVKKAEAARRWCESQKQHNHTEILYEFCTEEKIFPLMKLFPPVK